MSSDDPTPEERADFVVRLLEDRIRDARKESIQGMPLKLWQDMARTEIAAAVAAAEKASRIEERLKHFVVITIATAMVTIGFWGVVVSRTDQFNLFVAVVMGLAGIALFGVVFGLGTRKAVRTWEAGTRRRDFAQVMDLSRRIHRMRIQLEDLEKEFQEDLEAAERRRAAGDGR